MYRDSPDSGQRLHLPQLRLGTPGDLVAAIPALLGFTPHDSLLFVVLAPVSRAIDCIGRVNLTMPDDNLSAKLDDLVGLCLHAQSSEVLMIVVCGPAYTLDETALPTYRELAGKVSAYLHSHGICLRSAWATAEITPAGRWWSLFDDTVGDVSDPQSSPVAVRSVVAGRPIHSTRDDLDAIVAPDVSMSHDVGAVLAQCRTNRPDLDDDSPQARAATARDIERLLAAIEAVAAGETLTAADLAEAVTALHVPLVRDCMRDLVHTPLDAAANQLWAILTRAVPGPDRAEPALLLAYWAYVHGEGIVAGIALDVALQAVPTHSLAQLLSQALRSGIPPAAIAKLGATARQTASELGIALPA
ncbi:Uncharacterised protein [Nocardia africana]|uniref:DUF4192 domain-containing protein n=1 Tax=Nocardia africana TaxID=134964 RepID=A0A378X534_9NOCA|nr:Uncharacterised protein [Nocardia africana]